MVDVCKEILIEENELLKLRNEKLEKDVKMLEKSLRNALIKSSDLMIKIIQIRVSIDYCKQFNYSLDENYKKGYAKAFELVDRCLSTKEVK